MKLKFKLQETRFDHSIIVVEIDDEVKGSFTVENNAITELTELLEAGVYMEAEWLEEE